MSLAHHAQTQILSLTQQVERPLLQDGAGAAMLDEFTPVAHASAAAAANTNEGEKPEPQRLCQGSSMEEDAAARFHCDFLWCASLI